MKPLDSALNLINVTCKQYFDEIADAPKLIIAKAIATLIIQAEERQKISEAHMKTGVEAAKQERARIALILGHEPQAFDAYLKQRVKELIK